MVPNRISLSVIQVWFVISAWTRPPFHPVKPPRWYILSLSFQQMTSFNYVVKCECVWNYCHIGYDNYFHKSLLNLLCHAVVNQILLTWFLWPNMLKLSLWSSEAFFELVTQTLRVFLSLMKTSIRHVDLLVSIMVRCEDLSFWTFTLSCLCIPHLSQTLSLTC